MQWNDQGQPFGYDFQQPQQTGVTIRSDHAPKPTTLSRENANRVKEAVKGLATKSEASKKR